MWTIYLCGIKINEVDEEYFENIKTVKDLLLKANIQIEEKAKYLVVTETSYTEIKLTDELSKNLRVDGLSIIDVANASVDIELTDRDRSFIHKYSHKAQALLETDTGKDFMERMTERYKEYKLGSFIMPALCGKTVNAFTVASAYRPLYFCEGVPTEDLPGINALTETLIQFADKDFLALIGFTYRYDGRVTGHCTFREENLLDLSHIPFYSLGFLHNIISMLAKKTTPSTVLDKLLQFLDIAFSIEEVKPMSLADFQKNHPADSLRDLLVILDNYPTTCGTLLRGYELFRNLLYTLNIKILTSTRGAFGVYGCHVKSEGKWSFVLHRPLKFESFVSSYDIEQIYEKLNSIKKDSVSNNLILLLKQQIAGSRPGLSEILLDCLSASLVLPFSDFNEWRKLFFELFIEQFYERVSLSDIGSCHLFYFPPENCSEYHLWNKMRMVDHLYYLFNVNDHLSVYQSRNDYLESLDGLLNVTQAGPNLKINASSISCSDIYTEPPLFKNEVFLYLAIWVKPCFLRTIPFTIQITTSRQAFCNKTPLLSKYVKFKEKFMEALIVRATHCGEDEIFSMIDGFSFIKQLAFDTREYIDDVYPSNFDDIVSKEVQSFLRSIKIARLAPSGQPVNPWLSAFDSSWLQKKKTVSAYYDQDHRPHSFQIQETSSMECVMGYSSQRFNIYFINILPSELSPYFNGALETQSQFHEIIIKCTSLLQDFQSESAQKALGEFLDKINNLRKMTDSLLSSTSEVDKKLGPHYDNVINSAFIHFQQKTTDSFTAAQKELVELEEMLNGLLHLDYKLSTNRLQTNIYLIRRSPHGGLTMETIFEKPNSEYFSFFIHFFKFEERYY